MERDQMGKRGFSVIELVIVMVVIGVLAAFGIPRLRNSLEKSNIRGAKAGFATLVATARGVAVQRGCPATLNLTADSAWVTACNLTPPPAPATVVVGSKKLVGSQYSVTFTPSAASVTYDPRGIQTDFKTTTIRIAGSTLTDSVIINQVGKVIRQ